MTKNFSEMCLSKIINAYEINSYYSGHMTASFYFPQYCWAFALLYYFLV